eukprot:c9053_g1_i1.p1 GENE.c9053_g1_i1~~c9053_g1_i1.p1  ORF type:complete len:183 (+),score=42.57 c9053_g1_i1:112-660(+)
MLGSSAGPGSSGFAYLPSAQSVASAEVDSPHNRLLALLDRLGQQQQQQQQLQARNASATGVGGTTVPKRLTKHANFFGTLDGGLGYVLSITEVAFRRLLMVQTVMILELEHKAGLHPRAFRECNLNVYAWHPSQKPMLDGLLLSRFFHLARSKQRRIAKMIGLSPNAIVNTLLETYARTLVF